ncbi:hypothetical protein Tco_0396088 [Tanacetum coccineum]
MNLAVEFENASIAKDDPRKAYDECSDIPQEKRALIDTFLKQESDTYEPEAPEAALESPEHAPLSPVPAPEYPEYLASSDDDIPAKDRPLPADASLLHMDPVDYPSDEEEEEEPSTLTDPASHVPDYVPSSEETKLFETDESAATPPSPHNVVPLSHTGLRSSWKTVQPQPPLTASTEALIAEYGSTPTPPSPPPSPLSSLLLLIPSPSLLLPSLDRRCIIPAADMPPWKRACFTTPSRRFKIRESSVAAAAREPSEEFYTRHSDAHDDRALLQAQVSTLYRERRYHCHMAMIVDREAMYARQAWSQAMGCNRTLQAEVGALRAKTRVLQQPRHDDHDL